MQAEIAEQCLRPMHCQLNVLSRSDGSAMFTQGSRILLYGLNVIVKAYSFDGDFHSYSSSCKVVDKKHIRKLGTVLVRYLLPLVWVIISRYIYRFFKCILNKDKTKF
jgi:hypothetical protein